jgi:hypothetical protein
MRIKIGYGNYCPMDLSIFKFYRVENFFAVYAPYFWKKWSDYFRSELKNTVPPKSEFFALAFSVYAPVISI